MEKTLLDEFAMTALTGMLSDGDMTGHYEDFALGAYKYAQAMMEERKKHIKAEDEGWIDWNGGIPPVDVIEEKVEVKIKDGYVIRDWSFNLRWNHNESPTDIIKYRVLK